MRPVRILAPSDLDLDVDPGSEVELHQRVHGLRGRVDDIEHAQMRADLELLTRLLVDVRAAQDRVLLQPRRQRNRSPNPGTGPLGRADDFARRLVQHAMVERLQAYSDVLIVHDLFPSGPKPRPKRSSPLACLFDDGGDDAGADGAPAFADGEAQALV